MLLSITVELTPIVGLRVSHCGARLDYIVAHPMAINLSNPALQKVLIH